MAPEDWQDFELEVAVSDLRFPADPVPPVGPPEAAGPHRWSSSERSEHIETTTFTV
jgi:hypothetical protein